jgi:hypothetical protein
MIPQRFVVECLYLEMGVISFISSDSSFVASEILNGEDGTNFTGAPAK